MRILFAANYPYLPQFVGGSEVSTHELSTSLIKRGMKVAVLSSLGGRDAIWLYNRLFSKVFNTARCPMDNVNGYPVYRGWDLIAGAGEAVKHFKPSIAIVKAGDESMKLVSAFLSMHVPTVMYIRDVSFNALGGNFCQHNLLTFFANSSFTASRIYEKFGIKPKIIYPLIIPKRYKTKINRRKVIFINPIPIKGLEVACYLAKKRPDVKFDFIECWKIKKNKKIAYMKMVRDIPNITWKKSVLDMRNVYKHAKLVIVPSQWEEAWGRVVTEAHINGIPILASDSGGLRESVGPGGILISKDAPLEEWLDAFAQIWDDNQRYERLANASYRYSLRPEIQPENILNRFIDELTIHIERCRKTIDIK